MIYYKTESDLEIIKRNAQILGKAHAEVAKSVLPGVKTKLLDSIAETYIKDNGGTPSFLGYNGFPATLCMSVNDVVVHGFPSEYQLKDGDIVSIDCGVFKDGFHADSAFTYTVGEVDAETRNLLKVTKECLYLGIEQAKINNRIGDISHAIQSHAESNSYSVVRELVGHGVGKSLHEKPEVANYGRKGRGPKIKVGLVIAIEPMINLGKRAIYQEDDNWTIRTKDNLPSAHFEHTVAVLSDRTEILTTFEYIEEVLNKQYA